MALSVGDRLGPYEILSRLGAGGMGEVWKARDTRLGREVAIKVSAEQFSERFEREARAIAALNHPNICTLYDVGPNYLVMELIEGPTLADRIAQGPIPLHEALDIAGRIAEALEAAHEKGIVHRDLKPANIKVTPQGQVKVLDFGLAKAADEAPAGNSENSPTLTMRQTQLGVILGTAAYMAPEQARGRRVDKRADIWAFGVVLYEMLTGRPMFEGETVSDTLASVLKTEPDLTRLPAQVRRLLRKCLQKDPKQRLRDIGDAWELLEPERPASAPSPRSASRWLWGALAASLAAGAALAVVHFREQPPPRGLVRFEISPPDTARLTGLRPVVSPDGRQIVYAARDFSDSKLRLWVRPLGSFEAKAVAELDQNPAPFWSPDSRQIAFHAGGKLKRVEASGGPAQNICDAPDSFQGGAWNPNDLILFSGGAPNGMLRVSAAGGAPLPVTRIESSRQEAWHLSPAFLPDGRHFLYVRRSTNPDYSGVYIGSLDTPADRQPLARLLPADNSADFAPPVGSGPGYVLFLREDSLMAQQFDPARLQLQGDAVPIVDSVVSSPRGGYSVSATGVLVFQKGRAVRRQITSVDREGKVLGNSGQPGTQLEAALSPDGAEVATVVSGAQGNQDLWLFDLNGGTSRRISFTSLPHQSPIWSPDGKRIVFASSRGGYSDLYIKDASNTSTEELLLASKQEKTPTDWSRDGRFLLFEVVDPKASGDIWVLPMTGDRKPAPFIQSPFAEGQATFSPDAHYVAYYSSETGVGEIFVQSFPDGKGKWMISNGGGVEPRWRADGKELFYRSVGNGAIYSVEITTNPLFRPGTPRLLFRSRFTGAGNFDRNPEWAPSPDGKHFVGMMNEANAAVEPISVVLNWQAALGK